MKTSPRTKVHRFVQPAASNSALSLKLRSLHHQNASKPEAKQPNPTATKPQLTFEKTAAGTYKLVKAKCRSQEPMPREQPGPGSYLMKVNWAAAKETPEAYPKNAVRWKPQKYNRALAHPGRNEQSGQKLGPRATST